jgi:hypothetical protein
MNLVLDKSYLRGASTELVRTLCSKYTVIMPDVLFYELLTAPDWERTMCFRKIPDAENPLTLVPSIGDLFRFEVKHGMQCTPLSDRAVTRFRFNRSLRVGTFTLTPEQRDYINETEEALLRQAVESTEIWRAIDRFFPDLKQSRPGQTSDALNNATRTIASNENVVQEIYDAIRPESFPLAKFITPDWALYRWVQVQLLAALDFVSKYGDTQIPKAVKMINERHDLDYAVNAALASGLATRDEAMARRFRLVCPAGLLIQ